MITNQLCRRQLLTLALAGSLFSACTDSNQGPDNESPEVTIIVEPGDSGSALLGAIAGALWLTRRRAVTPDSPDRVPVAAGSR
ncbi:MAG: hypothetical protein QOI35_3246 [Cryptosporangiaceae bacterium]|nr:hypothetical protein [Cryptosporangiaceae bacterium]